MNVTHPVLEAYHKREILDLSRKRDSHRNVGHPEPIVKKEKQEMKSIYKTTIFIIGIAILSVVFVACGSSEDDSDTGAPAPVRRPW